MNTRYDAAISGGVNSSEWKNIPTLKDLEAFLSHESIQSERLGETVQTVKKALLEKLHNLLNSNANNTIGLPSSFSTDDSKLLVITVKKPPEDDQFTALCLSALSIAVRHAYEAHRSIVFWNGDPVLFENVWINKTLRRITGTGKKQGISFFLSIEDISIIRQLTDKNLIFSQCTDIFVEPKDYEVTHPLKKNRRTRSHRQRWSNQVQPGTPGFAKDALA